MFICSLFGFEDLESNFENRKQNAAHGRTSNSENRNFF